MPQIKTKVNSTGRSTRANHRRPLARTQTILSVSRRTGVVYGTGIAMYVAGSLAIITGLTFVLATLPAFPAPAPRFESASVPSTATAVTARWTAPGDDDVGGQASRYDLRYSTGLISEATFASATPVANLPPPRTAGQPESVTVGALQPGTTYYFALKTADEVPNWSALSNVTSATTAVEGCTPVWSCAAWSECVNSVMTRTCTDIANPSCGTTLNKPNESQACTVPPPESTCQEAWTCAAWSECVSGLQTRTCQDANRCDTTTRKPVETFDCGGAGSPPVAAGEDVLVVGPARRARPTVRVYNRSLQLTASFSAFDRTMTRGVTLAVGDVDGDEDHDIIAGTGIGATPLVRVFSRTGQRLATFRPFASAARTGVQVAAADIDGDRQAEVIAVPLTGPLRAVAYHYNAATRRFARLATVRGLSVSNQGGWSFAVADFNHDGRDELAIAPPRGERGVVRIFSYDPLTKRFGQTASFAPFGTRERLGLQLAAGDVNNDGDADVIVSRRRGAPPTVRVMTATGKRLGTFAAAPSSFRGGVTVAAVDTNLDGGDEIVTAVSDRGRPGLFVFRYDPILRVFFRATSLTPFGQGVRYGLRLASPPAP